MTVLLKQVMFYLHQPTRRFSPLLKRQLKGLHTTAFCRQVDHESNAQLPAKTIDLKKSNSSQDDTSDMGRCGFIKDFVPFRLPGIRTKPEPQITLDDAELRYHKEDFFAVRDLVTVRDLIDARCHYGHKTGSQNIHMRPYIFGNRLGVDVIDLDQTLPLLNDALNFTAHVAFQRGIIMFICRNRQCIPLVERVALACGEYSHCREFRTGTFTQSRSALGMETRLPDLAIMLTTHNHVFGESVAVDECAKLNIPIIGVVDTNSDPRLIDYPVPGNDDTPASMELYLALFKHAIERGKSVYAQARRLYDQGELMRQAKTQQLLNENKQLDEQAAG